MSKRKETFKQSELSQERIYDSSDEDEAPEISQTPKVKSKNTPLPKNNKSMTTLSKKAKQKVATQEQESEADAEPNPPSKSSEGGKKGEQEDDDSDVGDGQNGQNGQEESDTDSGTSSVSSQKRASPSRTEQLSRKRTKTSISSAIKIVPKPFKAPSGYEPVTLSASDNASDMSDVFGNLSGKVVWHISVPDTVSIESIKELDMDAALKGKSIFSRNGIDYNMQVSPLASEVFLLPQGDETSYRQSGMKISQRFELREMSRQPHAKEDTQMVFTATRTGKKKDVREQPGGLKMRYTPYGALPLPTKHEEVEMQDKFQVLADFDGISFPARSNKSAQANRAPVHEKSPENKTRGAEALASAEKKKKKKRRLIDENVS